MLLEDSPAVPSLALFFEEMGYSYERKKGNSPSLIKDGKVIRCKSDSHFGSRLKAALLTRVRQVFVCEC